MANVFVDEAHLSAIGDALRARTGGSGKYKPAEMAPAIAALSSFAPEKPLDPYEVYRATRPKDWLPMPEPRDDEMYMLFHVPDKCSALLAFALVCTGDYTIELGTMEGGAFRAKTSVTQHFATYRTEIFADDWGDLTTDGMKQVMIRLSGSRITTWAPCYHTKKYTAPVGGIPGESFADWSIVEIRCRLPEATSINVGAKSGWEMALRSLAYFACLGPNKIVDGSYMFAGAKSLVAVLDLYTEKMQTMAYMFQAAVSLIALPSIDTSQVEDFSRMFDAAYSLPRLPSLNTSRGTKMPYMFSNMVSLTEVEELDLGQATDTQFMFYGCSKLRRLPAINAVKSLAVNSMFRNCSALQVIERIDFRAVEGEKFESSYIFYDSHPLKSVKFNPEVTGWAGINLDFTDCCLGHRAIVDLFESLPTITAQCKITLTRNPGVEELTAEEQAVATGKNWTLVLA